MREVNVSDLTGHGRINKKASKVSEEIFLSYACALLVIAGADGDVSKSEFDYLINKAMRLGATDVLIDKIKQFDWRNADLTELTSSLNAANLPGNGARALLYDAIKVARADGDYHARERDTLDRTAHLLNVDSAIAAKINGIVEMEVEAAALLGDLLEQCD